MRFSRPVFGCLFASLVAFLLGPPLSAQTEQKSDYVLRTYEVGDLTISISDRPYSKSMSQDRSGFQGRGGGGLGGGGGGGGGQFSVPEIAAGQPRYLAQFGGGGFAGGPSGVASSNNSMDHLIDVIVATIDPDSWSASGGGAGEMQPFGTALVVWQAEPVQQKIQQLLTALRAGTGDRRTLKVDVRWLLLNSDDLARLATADDNGTAHVDRQVLAHFTRRPTSIRGLTRCFSGQLVYVVSGTQRNEVSGYIPVVGSIESPRSNEQLVAERRNATFRFVADVQPASEQGSNVGYQPIVQKTNYGALLEIRPTLVLGSQTAVVDLTATITVPGEQPNNPGGFAPSPAPPFVDRVAIETQQLATTLRLPLAEPVVVGGLTYKPASIPMGQPNVPVANEQASAESPQLYLILQIQLD